MSDREWRMNLFSLPGCRVEGDLKVRCGRGCWIVKQEIGYFHGKIWEMGVKTVKIILTTQATHGN